MSTSDKNAQSLEISERVADRIRQCRESGGWYLNLASCALRQVPEDVLSLTQVEEIDLDVNLLTQVPEALWNMPKLRRVTLIGNPLQALPERPGMVVSVEQFRQFRETLERNTFGLQLDDFYEPVEVSLKSIAVTSLQGLRCLDITGPFYRDYQQHEMPGPLCQDLLSRLEACADLEVLRLLWWNLVSVPESLRDLPNLRELYLTHVHITELPEWLGSLELEVFVASGNGLTRLPVALPGWQRMKLLRLGGNPLGQIPPAIFDLPNLEELSIFDCQIREIPREILRLTKLKKLVVDDNPIETPPPEVVTKGLEAIRDYWRQREKVGTDYLCEAKLILVGEPGAGKTSLAKKIADANYQLQPSEKSTEGIEVIQHRFPYLLRPKEAGTAAETKCEFQVNIWDFGGQEIYKATHQFFLTRRSVYVLVCDERQENTDFSYWLQAVEVLSEGCPLVIVQNEKQDRSRTMDFSKLRARFPNLHQVMAVNLATNRGLPELVRVIEQELGSLPHVGDLLPKTWKQVRTALEKETRETLSLDEYLNVCAQNDFKEHAHKLQLSSYLHDLGICLHFQEDPVLNRTVIIKPTWGTDAVYRVLDDAEVKAKWGRFTHQQLPALWHEPKYRGMEHELVALMMKFQLCYALVPDKEWIAPQLLAADSPAYDWPTTGGLVVRYQYEFLPRGIVTRCIVALHRLIADQALVWRHGVVLIRDGCRAEIVEEPTQNRIRVRVHGAHPPGLFAIIDEQLERLHAGFPKLQYERYLPCNCVTCVGSAEPRDFSLKDLLDFARTGDAIQCRGSRKMVDALQLLRDVLPGALKREGPEEMRMAGMREPACVVEASEPEVFVSYKIQAESVACVEKVEAALEAEGIKVLRDVREVDYKDSFREFMERLGRGNAIIVVLSKGYLESKFCMFELLEIAKATNLRQRIFPIVLPDANVFDDLILADYLLHWETKSKELKAKLDKLDGHGQGNLRKTLDLFADIRRMFDELTAVLGDMKVMSPDHLNDEGFATLIRQIREQVGR